MRSVTLKWILLLSTLLITVIMGAQLYWLNKVYRFEQKDFNNNVIKSIRGLYEDMSLVDNPGTQLPNLIEHPSPNAFLIKTDVIPDKDSLLYYLTTELENFDVFADCSIGLYNNVTGEYTFLQYWREPTGQHRVNKTSAPTLEKRPYSYIHLYFPHRQQYIIQQLGLWIVAAALVLLSLIALAVSLFYLYKQKTLNELQKDFVNNFTHEFKTPLAVMKLAAEVLASPTITQQPDRLKKYGSIVQQQTEHLQQQVNKLLATAATDEHMISLDISRFVLNEMINDVIQQLEPLIKQKNARIQLEPEEENIVLQGDKCQLSMVVVNLVENAIKYAETPYIIIKTSTNNGHYIISVKDNGIGIEKQHIPMLFKKFYRVPTGDVHNVKGFGLGLTFVKKVIDAHHGKIIVNSLPAIGTEFKIILPHH